MSSTTSDRSPLRWFADRRVGTKILVAVLAAVLTALSVGVLAISSLRSLSTSAAEIYQEGLVPVRLVAAAALAQDQARRELLNVLASQSPEAIEDNRGDVASQTETFDQAMDEYRVHAVEQGGGRVELLEEAEQAWAEYVAVRDKTLLPLAVDSKIVQFDVANSQAAAFVERVEESLAELAKIEDRDSAARRDAAAALAAGAVRSTIGLLAVGLLASVVLGLFVTRLVTRPLAKVSAVLTAMAGGDLTDGDEPLLVDVAGAGAQGAQAADGQHADRERGEDGRHHGDEDLGADAPVGEPAQGRPAGGGAAHGGVSPGLGG